MLGRLFPNDNDEVAEAAFQEIEFQDEAQAGHFSVELFHQPGDGGSGPAGGQDIVDDQHILAGRDGVLVDLQYVGPIFERVFDALTLGRKLFLLANRDKAIAQGIGDGGSDDEAARFNAEDQVDWAGGVALSQAIDDPLEPGRVFQQGGDVVEIDAWLREVGDFADEGFELVHSEGICIVT